MFCILVNNVVFYVILMLLVIDNYVIFNNVKINEGVVYDKILGIFIC